MSIIWNGTSWCVKFRVGGKQVMRTTGVKDRRSKSKAVLVGAEIEQAMRDEQGENGARLVDGYAHWRLAPRAFSAAEGHSRQVERSWLDFVEWMGEAYPGVRYIQDVMPQMAREYAQKVAAEGIRGGRATKLSQRSVNAYVGYVRSVFMVYQQEGECRNPFGAVPNGRERPIRREVLTMPELDTLATCGDRMVECLVIVGAYTGLRAGDLCRLRWDQVDEDAGVIRLTTGKTHTRVTPPILPPVARVLATLPRDTEYVMQEAAELYEQNPGGPLLRMQAAMDAAGIKHQVQRPSGRLQSVKGLHALRHTFVYLCAKSGVPIPAVQRAVGHMTAAMTQIYADHASEQDIREMMSSLPDVGAA